MRKLIALTMMTVAMLAISNSALATAGCASDATSATKMMESTLDKKPGTWWSTTLMSGVFRIYPSGNLMYAQLTAYGTFSTTVCTGDNSNSLKFTIMGFDIFIEKETSGDLKATYNGQTAALKPASAPSPTN